MIDIPTPQRPDPVAHDETPSIIISHAFEARGEWWTLCKHCHLAESAHLETTNPPFRYVSDDAEDFY